jgi:NAD(P)-dependent dehydrogenase (short-subunit alcohol dehydrogenase family)
MPSLLITGASKGIGRTTAVEFSSRGYRVIRQGLKPLPVGGARYAPPTEAATSAVEPRLCVDNRGADALASGRERAPG